MTNTLVLLRHAKSAWPPGVRDRQRPLNDRGRSNARAAGKWLAGFRPRPALAVVSPATRAQQTWEIARTALTREIDTRTEDAIYEASWVELLHVVQRLPSKHSCAIVVGHNPGLEDLIHELAGRADKAAARQLRTKYPTSAIAVLSSPQVWRQWDSGSARLDDLHIAR